MFKKLICLLTIILVLMPVSWAFGATIYINSNCSSGCDGTTKEKGYTKPSNALTSSSASDIFEFVSGSGPYYERVVVDATKDNQTWNFNNCKLRNDVDINALVAMGDYAWIQSSHEDHLNEYYLIKFGTNLIVNGKAEVAGTWLAINAASNGPSQNQVYDNTYSWEYVSDGGGYAIVYQTVALVGGTQYDLDVWVYGDGSTMAANIYGLGDSEAKQFVSETVPAAWTHWQYSVTPEASQDFFIRIAGTNNHTFYFDNAVLMKHGDTDPSSYPFRDIFFYDTSGKSVVVNGVWNSASQNIDGSVPQAPVNNWRWGDFDALGYDTLYVQYNSGEDPTGKNPIWFARDRWNFFIPKYAVGHTINNGYFNGSIEANLRFYEAVEVKNTIFYNSNTEGMYPSSGGTSLNGTSVTGSLFWDCGHRGINITNTGLTDINPFNIIGNTFVGVHLMLRNDIDSSNVAVVFKNNASYNLYAGGIEWIGETAVLDEGYNQFHINYSSVHTGKAIEFNNSNGYWGTTAPTDIPASFDTSSSCDASQSNCGTDPLFKSSTDFHLQGISPCIRAGEGGVDMGAYPFSTITQGTGTITSGTGTITGY